MNALLLIDIQNDFLLTGALPVPQGDLVIAVANRLMPKFDLIIASQDWHPPTHGSFAASHPGKKPGDLITLGGLQQILWPTHCVQGTPGADFAPGLDRTRITHITRKGTDSTIDSYSAFFDNGHRKTTDLHDHLRAHQITDLFILGLATDYCVKATALDARELGYRVHLIQDGCRGVNLNPGDVDKALADMQAAGVVLTNSIVLESEGRR